MDGRTEELTNGQTDELIQVGQGNLLRFLQVVFSSSTIVLLGAKQNFLEILGPGKVSN